MGLSRKYFWLVIPAILSVWGINYGLPLHLIGDEESLIGGALKMLELKQIIPVLAPVAFKLLYYPIVIPYLIILASLPVIIFKFITLQGNLLALKDYFLLNLDSIWLSSRLLASIFSLGVIVVVYKLAQRLLSNKAAFLSAIILSLSFFQLSLAHWTRHWIFTTFFVYLTILLAVNFVQGHLKKYWLIGIVGAISLATTYTAILGFGSAWIFLWFNRKKIASIRKVLIINILVFIALGGLLVYLNWPDIYRILVGETSSGQAKTLLGLVTTWWQVILVLFRQELIIFILFLLSLFFWRRQTKLKIFILSWLLIYLTALYYFVHFELRYIYLFIPALVILSGDSLVWLDEKINNKKIFYIFFGIALLWPLATVVRYDYLLVQADTGQLAIDYIKENIKDQNFVLSSEYIYLPRTKTALEQADNYGHINATERYTLSNYDRLASGLGVTYNYQNIHFWDKDKLSLEAAQGYRHDLQNSYFIVDYWQASDLTAVEDFWRNSGTLVKKFSQNSANTSYDINADFSAFNSILFKIDRLGPVVEIYKLY